MIPQVPRLARPTHYAFDLLNVVYFEEVAVELGGGLEEQGDEHGGLGVRVDAAPGTAAGEGGEEEGRALGGLVDWRGAEIDTVLGVELLFER